MKENLSPYQLVVGRKGELNRDGGRCGRFAWCSHWCGGGSRGCEREGNVVEERWGGGGVNLGRLPNNPPGNSRAGYV